MSYCDVEGEVRNLASVILWGYYLGVWFVAVIYLGSGASFLKIFTNMHEIVRDFFP